MADAGRPAGLSDGVAGGGSVLPGVVRGTPDAQGRITSWERIVLAENRQHYLYVHPHEVVCGSQGSSVFSDNAGSCTHAEFVAGQLQYAVRTDFGEGVVAEVLATLASLRARG